MGRPDRSRFKYFSPNDQSAEALSHRADAEYWEMVRHALFEQVTVQTSRGRRKISKLDAFSRSLNQAARQGDEGAIRELSFYQKLLRDKHSLGTYKLSSTQAAIEKQKGVASLVNEIFSMGLLYVRFHSQIIHARIHGPESSVQLSTPFYIDASIAENQLFPILLRRMRAMKQSEKVGYKCPPASKRFKPGQSGNPSGKAKAEDQDGWNAMRSGLMETVPVVQNGQTRRVSSATVVVARLVERAIQGSQRARRELRKLLVELDGRRLLTPPVQKKRRRKKISAEELELYRQARPLLDNAAALQITKELREEIEIKYGGEVYEELRKYFERESRDYVTTISDLLDRWKQCHDPQQKAG